MARRKKIRGVFFALLGVLFCAGCQRDELVERPSAPSTAQSAKPTIASLVPAATDLLLAMGAGDQLVAVSNYDIDREGIRGLPRVGDYQNTDWEQLRALHPAVMIRQFAPDRMPPGLQQHARELDIQIVNVRIDRLEDVFSAMGQIGRSAQQPEKAENLQRRIRAQVQAVRERTNGLPKVRTLILRNDSGSEVIGPDNFLDDLLEFAGGSNAAVSLKNPYPSIDRETIRALDPEAIVVLLPGATPQSLARSKATWESMPSLSAVRSRRVYTLTDWYVQLPGPHVGDVARQLAEALHPSASFSATRDDASVMWAAKSVRWDAKSMTLGATLMAFSHTFLTLAAPSLTFASASLALAAPSLAFASTSPTFAAPSLTLVRP